MFCSYCGASLAMGQSICAGCGRDLRGATLASDSDSATGYATPADAPTALTPPGNSLQQPARPSTGGLGATRTQDGGPLAPGAAFGSRYSIIRLLGIGGMGAVYQAWDDELGEAVALKVVRPEIMADQTVAHDLERRFKRELLLARQVTHKNVVRIHDLGEIEGIKYLTMPYIQGSDLGTVLAREKKLQVARAVSIAKQVVSGLIAAHEAGVVHRDLKPANIMIDADDHAVIMDFGIARSISGNAATMAGAVIGTLEYMAPEQAMARPTDHRADIYAFGLILYDMVVGPRHASRAESAVAELMARVQNALPPLRSVDPSLPEALERIIDRCTQPDPAARYQTTAELAAEIDQLAGDGRRALTDVWAPPPSTRPTAPVRAGKAGRQLSVRQMAAAAAVLVAVASAAWLWRDRLPSGSAGSGKPVSLAILPFRNASGDAGLDWLGRILADMTRTELGQAPGLRIVSSERLAQILGDLRIPHDGDPDPTTYDRLAQYSNADIVVAGQFVKFGSAIRLEATLNGPNRTVVPLKAQAADDGQIPTAVKALAQAILPHLSSSGGTGAARSALPGPSSASMPALKAYTEGEQLSRQNKHQDARVKFEEATKGDPRFALAFAKLAQTYRALGYGTEAEQASRTAGELSESLPEEQRYLIDAMRAGVANDTSKAIEAYERLERIAPNDSQILFDLAKLYDAKGDLDRARDMFKRVLDLDPKYVSALIALGQVEIRRRNFNEALNYLTPAYHEAVQTGNEPAKGAALHATGVAFKRLNKPEDALRNYEQALEIRRRIKDRRGTAATLTEMGQVLTTLQRTDAALVSFNESVQISREINDKRGEGLTLIGIGGILDEREEYDKALDMYKQALQIQIDLGNDAYQALCHHNIAWIHLQEGRYDDAMTYFQNALQTRETSKVPSDIAETLQGLANAQAKVGQYDAALPNYLRALELRRKANDDKAAATVSEDMAMVFAHQGRYAAALGAHESALKPFRESGDARGLAAILDGYAATLIMLGRFEQAQSAIQEASDLARKVRAGRLIASSLNTQGNRSYYKGDYQGARAVFAQALRTSEKFTNPELRVVSAMNVAKNDVREGRASAAVPRLRELAGRAERLRLRPLAAECSLYLGEALLVGGDSSGARRELEAALTLSERLGLRSVSANAHYLLAMASSQIGDKRASGRHLTEARQIVDAIRKEAGTDDLLNREDLKRIVSAARTSS